MNRKKLYLIILLSLFFLLCLGAGIYVLLTNKTLTNKFPYLVNRYQDTVNWCDTSVVDNTLKVDCKGLLLDIRNLDDGSSCFDVQIITKDKELKEISICESKDTLTYTNDVLGYKKLMPIGMMFEYTGKGILKEYSFNNIALTKLDDTYVQGIINEDIANLVTIDPTTTTIQNSVDFCPKPEILPNYISESNKIAYTEFFNKNTMSREKYLDGYLYSWDDDTIRILFACDSAENMGYTDICDKTKIKGLDKLEAPINDLVIMPTWGRQTSTTDEVLLKEISLIYDSIYLNIPQNSLANLGLFNKLLENANSIKTLSEDEFCGIVKIQKILEYTNYDLQIDSTSITNSNSLFCNGDLIDEDMHGKYLRILYSQQNALYSRCNNIKNLLSNEL